MTSFSPYHTKSREQCVAVIGAGIIGVSCALYLQEKGFKVTLIDSSGVGQKASKGNAGHFATEQIFPLADRTLIPSLPKMLLDPLGPFRIKPSYFLKALPWFMRFLVNMSSKRFNRNKQALKALNEVAIPHMQYLVKKAQVEPLMTLSGSLLVFESEDTQQIEKLYQMYKNNGVNVESLSREQALEIEPNLSANITAALLFPDVGHTCDPERLTKELFNLFIQQGGHWFKGKIDTIKPEKANITVIGPAIDRAFNHVVVAAGAWSKSLIKPLGYKVPLEAERGYHSMVSGNFSLSRPVASYTRKFIMTPMTEGLRLAGTVEFAGRNTEPQYQRADAFLPHANAILLEQISSDNQNQKWMGPRPSLPDSLPVISKSEQYEGLYFAFGHQHLGLTQAGITGKLISQLVSKEKTEIDVRPYSIERFK